MVTKKKSPPLPLADAPAFHNMPGSFKDALTSVYLESPCSVLPNALWKTTASLDQFDTSFTCEDGKVTGLKIADNERLMLWWQRSKSITIVTQAETEKLNFALLHQRYIENFNTADFDLTPYFRLIHAHRTIPQSELLPGFALAPVHPKEEAGLISDLISRCYGDINPLPKTVLSWIDHPVYDPSLWLWVIDTEKDIPVGLGIAEYDPEIREGSLEWIQVLGDYHSLGLGKFVCSELLNRLKERAKFTTVSGQRHNDTRPDILYRKLGFQGRDIWWILRRKSAN